MECDERRQAVVVKRPFTSELSPIRRKHGLRDKVDASDNISIRIDGHRANKVLVGNSQKPVPRQESTEPMLLDEDETSFHKLTGSQTDYPEQKSLVQTSLLDLSSEDATTMASNHSRQSVVTTQVYSDLPVDDTDTDQRTPNRSPTAISTANIQRNSNGSISPISHNSTLPVLRRFTIDDQVLAERENEMAGSLSSIGQQSSYETHVHNPTSQPSPEPLFRSRSYDSESNLINSSDGTIHRTESHASYQTGSGWLPPSEREGKATRLFATPNRRMTSIQDTETCDIARTREDWDIHAGSACEGRTPPPIFFGQTMPGVDQVQSPSLRSDRLVEQRSPSVSGRSQQERSELDMHTPRFMHEPSVPDSRHSSRQSSRHTSRNSYDDGDQKFTTNIHCNATPMRASFNNRNRAILSLRMHSETNIKEGRQPSTSPFRFPAYWTPQQQGRRHTGLSAGSRIPLSALSAEEENNITDIAYYAPSSSSFLSFSIQCRQVYPPDTGERPQEHQDDAVWEDVDNNNNNVGATTIPPFFNTPFRR